MIREELEKLSKLQEIDLKIDRASKLRSQIPQALSILELEVTRAKQALATLVSSTQELERQKRMSEIENDMDANKVKLNDERIGELANKDYHYMAKNTDKAKKSISDRLLVIGQLAIKISGQQTVIDSTRADVEAKISTLETKKSEFEIELGGLDSEAQAFSTDRQVLIDSINQKTVSSYNRLRTRMSDAVAIVSNGSCQSCRMTLPPQMYAHVQKGQEIFNCPNCQRIIYFRQGLTN